MVTYAVNLRRTTNDPRALIAFYQVLGLRTRVDHEAAGFTLMKAGDGWVSVVRAAEGGGAPGAAQLTFLTRSVDTAAAHLRDEGFHVREWDTPHGLHAAVTNPAGQEVWITQVQPELVGYQAHDDPVTTPLVVVGVLYSPDFARDSEFFAHFGLEPVGKASEHWSALDGRRGRVGLHASGEGMEQPRGGPCAADLGFETSEPLGDVVHRLHQAGFDDARLVQDEHVSAIHVTDPDGLELQIHRLTA